MLQFEKYHALGNDYLVLDPRNLNHPIPTPGQILTACHRHFGIGSDGILFGPLAGADGAEFGLRIFNPDGSEAEKSGNGLRIFSRYLADQGLVGEGEFSISTLGGLVRAQVSEDRSSIRVEMGHVSFHAGSIPVAGPEREVLQEKLEVAGQKLEFSAATVGNPHCVIVVDALDHDFVMRLGPQIERHEMFPNRTNVQFVQVVDRQTLSIEIWERGAGYTLASGSSSCAAAAVTHRLGMTDSNVTVRMPGGTLAISISPDFEITMTGPVVRIGAAQLSEEAVKDMAFRS